MRTSRRHRTATWSMRVCVSTWWQKMVKTPFFFYSIHSVIGSSAFYDACWCSGSFLQAECRWMKNGLLNCLPSLCEILITNNTSFSEQCKPLERALDEWSSVLRSGKINSLRNPKQTCSSIAVLAALFKLMGKVIAKDVLVFILETLLHSIVSFLYNIGKILSNVTCFFKCDLWLFLKLQIM